MKMNVTTRSQRSREKESAQVEQIPDLLQARPGMSDSIKTLIFITLFIAALASMAFVFVNFPPMREEHKARLKLPKSIGDVKELGDVISTYKEDYYFTVMLGFSLVYIFLQTFSIPGSIFLSFLGGTLFGRLVGTLLVCFLAACGASGAFGMSYLVGRRLLQRFAAARVAQFGRMVAEHRSNLVFYFLFLRFSPLLPNWFVNLASPIVNVPFHVFFIGTFIGVMPQTAIAVNAGVTLQSVQSVSDIFDVKYFFTLLLLGFGALIPTLKPVQAFFDSLLARKSHKQE